MAPNVAAALRLVLVTDDRLQRGRSIVETCLGAVQGGVTSVQLRLKEVTARELVRVARALIAALPVPVLVNDRLDVALAAGAAGVHLGPDDVPIRLARTWAPQGFMLGASVGSASEADDAGDADYWGIGPWHATATKSDAGNALGAAGFGALAARSVGRPCIAIGGIRPSDLESVRQAGGTGVAVVSGILGADDVAGAARMYSRAAASAFARDIAGPTR